VLAARGFSGITVMEPHDVAQRLGHLATDVLPASAEVIETLERWGVRNLRALAVLPPVALTERLGQEGLRLQKLARGEQARPLVPAIESFHFEERFEFEDAVDLLEPLSFVLNRMLEQLCARLQSRALATNQLELQLELEVNEDKQIAELPNCRIAELKTKALRGIQIPQFRSSAIGERPAANDQRPLSKNSSPPRPHARRPRLPEAVATRFEGASTRVAGEENECYGRSRPSAFRADRIVPAIGATA
jgi:nucleotidyltransferase/DNA polymerase involved in DNA repair